LAACAAVQQQKAQQSRAADTGQFHNLTVLPQNITHDELVNTMRAFSRSLGTRCDHCHAANPAGSAEAMNFASDAKPEKNVARAMMRMTQSANQQIATVNTHGQTVTCNTCHRGHTIPDTTPVAAAPAATP
jgi:predicted trehalose synthase